MKYCLQNLVICSYIGVEITWNFFNVIYIVAYNEFFLGKQKKDVSDKSKDGEDSKKLKESDSLSSLPDEVFSDGLNSLESAKLLVNCFRSIENQVKELFAFGEEAKESQIKVTESLEFMSAKFDDLKKEIKKKYGKIKKLEKTIENLRENVGFYMASMKAKTRTPTKS